MKPLETPVPAPTAKVGRRKFFADVAQAAAAGFLLTSCGPRRLHELPKDALMARIAELEREARDAVGTEVRIGSEGAMPGVRFAYALDLSRCVGCRRCVYACAEENNLSRDPQIHWIRVAQMEKERGVDFSHANFYYEPETVPEKDHVYVPVACQQCRKPPCVKVCPVGATWKEPDGIVVVDYDWCIGCRYCMAACPYGARHFNWRAPKLETADVNPETHLYGNRPRPKGVVEKCTFCIQRTRKGRYPACVEVCPAGARKFGNILDPGSEIRHIIEHKKILVLKEELDTLPSFYYFYGA
ncbi:MAG: hypothetical protein AMXMBFR64_06000 [Myxococcales bacterium]